MEEGSLGGFEWERNWDRTAVTAVTMAIPYGNPPDCRMRRLREEAGNADIPAGEYPLNNLSIIKNIYYNRIVSIGCLSNFLHTLSLNYT